MHSRHRHGEGPPRELSLEEIARRQQRIARRERHDERRAARIERHRPDRPLGFWGRVGEWIFFPALFLGGGIAMVAGLATGANFSWRILWAIFAGLAGLTAWIRAVPLRYRKERAQPAAGKTVAPPPWRHQEREKPDLETRS